MARSRRTDEASDLAATPARRARAPRPAPRPKNRFATKPRVPQRSADPRREDASKDLRWLYARRPRAETALGEDPFDPRFARTGIAETPSTVLTFWFGFPDQGRMVDRNRMDVWFSGKPAIDRIIAGRFLETLAQLASGAAWEWAARGPKERLAAIIALDQFTRSIFRKTEGASENDPLALALCLEGLESGAADGMSPFERWFFIMPLMHAEEKRLQARSVSLFRDLEASAPEEAKDMFENARKFAELHADVIRRFGRFPTRNAQLGRESTWAEKAYLAEIEAGLVQGF